MASNGETTVENKGLTYAEKLDIIITALTELTEKTDAISEKQDELVEKLSNLNTNGSGFHLDDEFDS